MEQALVENKATYNIVGPRTVMPNGGRGFQQHEEPVGPKLELKRDRIYCSDCIELLTVADDLKPRLIFADPPFNIGCKYETYDDRHGYDEYVEWTRGWMSACHNVLADDGSLYIAIGDKYAAELKIIAGELGLTMRNWIIWHYTFGQNMTKKFGRSHNHILYFVKDPKNFTFNADAVRVPSERQLKYNDRRADPRGRVPGDVWRYSRVCGTFRERVRWHPCQMPLALMARIIKASSNPGDFVLDPFSGSASTCVAAAMLGRHYLGIDIDPKYAELGQKRVEEALQHGVNVDVLVALSAK